SGRGPAAGQWPAGVAFPASASAAVACLVEASPAAYSADTPAVDTVGADKVGAHTAVPVLRLPGMAHPDRGRPGIPAAAGSPHPRRVPVACLAGRQVARPGAVVQRTGPVALLAARWASARAQAAG